MLGNNLVQFRPTAEKLQVEGEQSINLSCEQDRFYRENRYEFWPVVTEKIGDFQSQCVARFCLAPQADNCSSIYVEMHMCRGLTDNQIQKDARRTP